jgi:lysosomal acid lipase/cholesteryl ester hydrolase
MLAALSDKKLTDVVRSVALLCPIAYLNRMKLRLILLAARIFLAEVKQCRTNPFILIVVE